MGLWDAQVETEEDRAAIKRLTSVTKVMILESPSDEQQDLETGTNITTGNGLTQYKDHLQNCTGKSGVRDSTALRYMRFFKTQ